MAGRYPGMSTSPHVLRPGEPAPDLDQPVVGIDYWATHDHPLRGDA